MINVHKLLVTVTYWQELQQPSIFWKDVLNTLAHHDVVLGQLANAISRHREIMNR